MSKKTIVSRLLITLLVGISLSALAGGKEVLIPRSMAGDKGKYYLLQVSRSGDITKTVHKRVGVDSVGFSRTEINCKNQKYRDIGYGEDSVTNIQNYPLSNWTNIIQGSSKSDLAAFVCK